MTSTVTLPLWLFILILLFAAVTALSHFLLPSVRWFLRRRMEKVVAQINTRLERPIQPFKLARRHDMIQRLIYDPEVSRAIVAHARETGVREDVAFQEAQGYAREIVPSFSASAYFGFAIRAARWLSHSLYRVRLVHHDEEALRAVDPDATVVFVMNHRSNMDYVLVTYLAAERSALAYAVGEWARVWPLSRLIKAMGAYFIRRRSRNALYRRVLARYVQLATEGGVTQAIFPEGGLSLDGGPQPPKLGLLSYIAEGVDLAERDVVFVPVALNYDRVLEDRILLAAGQAGTRRFNARISVIAGFALKQLWRKLRGRFHRFGYAGVSFGRPLSLRDFRADRGGTAETRTDELGAEIMLRIAEVVPVLPVPLLSTILLADGAQTRAALEVRVAEVLERVPAPALELPRPPPAHFVDEGLRRMAERSLVRIDGEMIHPGASNGDVLGYYAQSIAHLLPDDAAGAK